MKSFLKPTFLLVIFAVSTNGQTHIKDQIEIKPKQLRQNLPDYLFMKPDSVKFVPFKYDESMGKELIEERTLYRKVFLQPDGTKKARIYASPIHFLNENNNFENITSVTQIAQTSQNIVSTQNAITDRHVIYPPVTISNTIFGGDVFPDDYLPIGNAEYIYYKLLTISVWDENTQQYVDIPIMQYDVRGIQAKTLIKIDIDSLAVTGTITDAKLNVYLADRYWYSSAISDSLCNRCLNVIPPPLSYLCDYSCPAYGPNPGEQYQYISASIITDSTDWWDTNNYLPTYEDTSLFHIDSLGKMMTFDVLNAMEGWKNGTIDNHGLILQSSHITDARRMFHLERYGAYAPYFEITYTDSIEPKLRIIEPDSTALGECILPYLDENLPIEQIAPAMPQVTCKAVFDGLSSLTTDTIDVNWEYIMEYDYWWRDIEVPGSDEYIITARDPINGTTQVSSMDTTAWLVNFTDQFLGGKVSVIANAVINDSIYSDTLKNIYEIRGTNPTPQKARDMVEYLEPSYKYQLWTIMYYETATYTNQFIGFSPPSDVGLPLYGYPAGYGLFQNDPVSSIKQLWSWLANIKEGIRRFKDEKLVSVDKYVNRVRAGQDGYIDEGESHDRKPYFDMEKKKGFPGATDFSTNPANDQHNIDLHQLYRGHHYYVWKPEDNEVWEGPGKWIVNPIIIEKGWLSGAERDSTEKAIINGNYPLNWDAYLEGCTK